MRRPALTIALLGSLALSPLSGKDDAAPGETLWEIQVEGRVMATAALDAQRVYFGTSSDSANETSSSLYCLDREDGEEVWSQTFPNWLQACPAITDTRLFVGCDDTKLYCLDKTDGSELWHVDTAGRIDSTPCVDTPGNCYFGSRDRFFYAVDPNGVILWSRFLTQGIASSPLLDEREGRLYVADLSNTIYAFTLTGEELWRYKPRLPDIEGVRLRIYSSPAIDDETFLYIGSGDKHLYAVDRNSGRLFWRENTGGVVDSSPVISADRYLYVANREGSLIKYFIDPFASEREVWRNDTIGQVFYGSPSIDSENNIYICGAPPLANPEDNPRTQLSYINNSDGEILWFADFPGYTDATPLLDESGDVYLGTASGNFVKVRGAGNGLAETSWPTFRGHPSGKGRYEEAYRQWLIRFGIPPEFANTDRDSDSDGFRDFEEFVFGSHPTDPTQQPNRAPTISLGTLAFKLQKGIQANVFLEMSSDLTSWSPVLSSPSYEDEGATWQVEVPLESTLPANHFRVHWQRR